MSSHSAETDRARASREPIHMPTRDLTGRERPMSAEQKILNRLLDRMDRYQTRFEQTGDERFADIAAEADRMYRHAKAALS